MPCAVQILYERRTFKGLTKRNIMMAAAVIPYLVGYGLSGSLIFFCIDKNPDLPTRLITPEFLGSSLRFWPSTVPY